MVDGGAPRNAPAEGVHNYLAREGTPPAQLLAIGREEVAGYGGEIVDGTVTGADRVDDGFRVALADGRNVHARRLLVTTGLVDELPDVPGVAELWGHGVLHCPYCHGWEVRDQPVGILSTGPMSVHHALMWRQWTPDVVLFLHSGPAPIEEEREQLAARGITVVEGELTGVRLASGEVVARSAVVVATRMTARAGLLGSLGLEPAELEMGGHVFGTYIPADPMGATAVPGVWVAGNVANLHAQVVVAAGAGVSAGAAINADLIAEDTRQAVAELAGVR